MKLERLLWEIRFQWAKNPSLRLLAYACAAVALCFVLALSGCAAASRPAQAQVADAIARAANLAEPAIVDEYRRSLFGCLNDATNRAEYDLCRAKADHTWTRVRLAWGHLRLAQDDYAKSLEKGAIDITVYLDGLRIAYCEFKTYVPATAKLPEIPALVCPELAP